MFHHHVKYHHIMSFFFFSQMGIHHVSRPLPGFIPSIDVSPSLGKIHHYRSCLADFALSCKNITKDYDAVKFRPQLEKRALPIINSLKGDW